MSKAGVYSFEPQHESMRQRHRRAREGSTEWSTPKRKTKKDKQNKNSQQQTKQAIKIEIKNRGSSEAKGKSTRCGRFQKAETTENRKVNPKKQDTNKTKQKLNRK